MSMKAAGKNLGVLFPIRQGFELESQIVFAYRIKMCDTNSIGTEENTVIRTISPGVVGFLIYQGH